MAMNSVLGKLLAMIHHVTSTRFFHNVVEIIEMQIMIGRTLNSYFLKFCFVCVVIFPFKSPRKMLTKE